MSFDYIHDLFGEYRGYETRYTTLEKQAIGIIRQYHNHQIDSRNFAESMRRVHKSFLELDKKDDNGNTIIDQDVPLWLGNFLAFKFLRWHNYHALMEAAKTNPELTRHPNWPNVMEQARHFDSELDKAMEYCLSEWDRIHNPDTATEAPDLIIE